MSIPNSLLIFFIFYLSTVSVYVAGRKGFGPGSQEYGYVDVRKGAHFFYWLYYKNTVPQNSAPDHPLVFWLQGGPGAASTGYGNFFEMGTLDTDLKPREHAWTKYVNVVFLDNPVGTGFSYVDNKNLLVKNNKEISADLITFTKAFYKKFPKFEKTPLYIFSESYGGKMAIQFAYDLSKEIKKEKLKINLVGVAMGDSWISPVDSCLTWGPYLFNLGRIDEKGNKTIAEYADKVRIAVEAERWEDATSAWSNLEDTLSDVAGGVDFYNVLNDISEDAIKQTSKDSYKTGLYGRMLSETNMDMNEILNEKVKPALKSVIPSKVNWVSSSYEVFNTLTEDFMKPVTHYVEKALKETELQVIVYNGQLDLIVDTPGTVNWMYRLQWPGADKWKQQNFTNLFATGREGLIKSYERFTYYYIERSGHMLPHDNPEGAAAMLKLITKQS